MATLPFICRYKRSAGVRLTLSYMCSDICEHQDSDCVQSCSESSVPPSCRLWGWSGNSWIHISLMSWHSAGWRSEVREERFTVSNLNNTAVLRSVADSKNCVSVCLRLLHTHLLLHTHHVRTLSLCVFVSIMLWGHLFPPYLVGTLVPCVFVCCGDTCSTLPYEDSCSVCVFVSHSSSVVCILAAGGDPLPLS